MSKKATARKSPSSTEKFITISIPRPKRNAALAKWSKSHSSVATRSPAPTAAAMAASASALDFDGVVDRTLLMLAALHNIDSNTIDSQDKLREKYGYTDDNLKSLRKPINGHWFKDVNCNITPSALKACKTVEDLILAIEKAIP